MTRDEYEIAGKRCLVTGGMGFVGAHLCARLCQLGAHVTSVDIEDKIDGTLFGLLNKNAGIPLVTADLADPGSAKAMEKLRPDIIFHLAGCPYAPYTTAEPQHAFRANVVTTSNMLNLARITATEMFVFASSACVFGATEQSPISVNGKRFRGEHYYTYTKRQAEEQVEAYGEFYKVPSVICRFVNIFGPGDRHFGRLVPSLCYQLVAKKTSELELRRSSGDSVLEFLYVNDAVSGLLAACGVRDKLVRIYHFGPGPYGRVKVSDIAHKLSINYDARVRKLRKKNVEGEKTVRKYLDIRDTEISLNWKATWMLDDGLFHTLQWYRENMCKLRPITYSTPPRPAWPSTEAAELRVPAQAIR